MKIGTGRLTWALLVKSRIMGMLLFTGLLTGAAYGVEETENVYVYANYSHIYAESDMDAEEKDAVLHDAVCFDSRNGDIQTFIKSYLEERNLYKEDADGINYGGEAWRTEYYIDSENEKITFVVHSYYESVIDFDTKETGPVEIAFCITIPFQDMEAVGQIVYTCNDDGRVNTERYQNTAGEIQACASYEYMPGSNIPLITAHSEKEDAENGGMLIGGFLNRAFKFDVFKDCAKFDKEGKLCAYDAFMGWDDNWCGCCYTFSYVGDRLKDITDAYHEDLKEGYDIEYSGQILPHYGEKGALEWIEYWHSGSSHGTWDCAGEIFYDDLGRMTCNSCYVTHGSHYLVYLYEDEEMRPWAVLEICSMSKTGDEDGNGYGNGVNAVFFEPWTDR